MLTDLVKRITNYIDYLRSSLKLQVSFCNVLGYFEPYMHIFQPYNSHYNAYCACIKTNRKTHKICVQNQHKVLKASVGGEFYGVCWAGVEEYVFPIFSDNMVLGFISVSGYSGQIADSEKRIKTVSNTHGIDYGILKSKYESGLSSIVPPLENLKPIIEPLCSMFEMLFAIMPKKIQLNKKANFVYADILNYLCYHYSDNITLEDVARSCNYSKSYIRQIFKKKSNRNIKHYLVALRIKRAKELLSNTSMKINEISFEIGYGNPNYFTNAFKKETGLTPNQYRKARQSEANICPLDTFCNK